MQQKRNSIHAAVLAAAVGLGTASGAAAQGFLELEQTPVFLGLGIGVAPDYKGSDDSMAGIAPYFRYTFPGQERYVQLFANELSLNLVNSKMFRFGPVLNYHFGRDDGVEDKVVKRMEEIDDTVELGVFGDIAWIDAANPRNRFILGATLLQDVGDESDGFSAKLSARYWHQVHQAVDVQLGGGVIYGNNKYTDHYFGVNADNVGTSGLPAFKAEGGMNEYYLTVGTAVYLSREWVVGAGVRYSRITGDAADSPLVDQRGDENQVVGGIGVAYIWR
jgi:MipA family protein